MQGTAQDRKQSTKAISQRVIAIAGVVLLAVVGTAALRWVLTASVEQEEAAPIAAPVIQTVTALGRLEPRGTVIALSAPTASQGNRVEQLLVQEGDRIQAGQVIAILDSHDQRQAALAEAEEQVNVARAQLDVIQAGAKQGEINAQQAEIERLTAERQGSIDAQAATVDRLQSELRNVQVEFDRYQSLYERGAISASERDNRRLALETAQASAQEAQVNLNRLRSVAPPELNRARATLEQIAEVRPVDVRSAQAEVERAIAARNQALASFDQSIVRSPVAGEVLDIHTRAGEVVSSDGIAEIGQTQQMQVVAEVYQSDVGKVQAGQRVRITSDSITGELIGRVERVGSQVRRQAVVNTDPSANIDDRVVEVYISLDEVSSQKAAKFTNLQVEAVIEQ
ncbi:HlyD family efflux transporter periplasmic adaptor subunit [Pseudanabaena sp. FACHB-2040]|uniref:HlyD family efflux transporter periplasmic adaptor subunit n=1 Tax=Pseudanabaena sp. FACHB-2040 TaxID=2692859 RepID=UPI001683A6A5|nr:HlyD family efflux transporter periplasmic adaptor subunit [Pseudanabaena sp. FACHB-2040]MBD2258260.1 HlyD family efflux transporter periplasmic adaptor subunit [Pseudanabaena sp. FACHB-2040]